MVDKMIFVGNWFISEHSEILRGVLTIDKDRCKQTLQLYSDVDFLSNKLSDRKIEFEDNITICGNCKLNNKITLSKCLYKGKKFLGSDNYEITYEPEYSFIGCICFEINELKITSLTCTFPLFASWYDTTKLFFGTYSDKYGGVNEYLCDEDLKPALKEEQLIDEIELLDGFRLIVERFYEKECFDELEVKHKITHFVHIKNDNPQSFNDFQKLAVILEQLISLSTCKKIIANILAIEFLDDSTALKLNKTNKLQWTSHISINRINRVIREKSINYSSVSKHYLLLYGDSNQNSNLKEIIKNWFATYYKYQHIYNIYLDTFEWFQDTNAYLTEIMFKNRLVNLVQALENYDYLKNGKNSGEDKKIVYERANLLLSCVKNQEDREWLLAHVTPIHVNLRKRLESLISEFSSIIYDNKLSNKRRNSIIDRLKTIRDNMSHGEGFELNSNKISEDYYFAQILLLSCILSNLGLTNVEIKNALHGNIKYASIIMLLQRSIVKK